ncbi:hypothetical protein, partial [Nocardia abscessus]|uniref:hypothetical protein n=1 Tax=Nocardia abscessus TaxID=120957 RepID=UPI002453DE61
PRRARPEPCRRFTPPPPPPPPPRCPSPPHSPPPPPPPGTRGYACTTVAASTASGFFGLVRGRQNAGTKVSTISTSATT